MANVAFIIKEKKNVERNCIYYYFTKQQDIFSEV
jgi:hypothetical protein